MLAPTEALTTLQTLWQTAQATPDGITALTPVSGLTAGTDNWATYLDNFGDNAVATSTTAVGLIAGERVETTKKKH